MLTDIPAGCNVYMDANILVYHFTEHAQFGQQATRFLARIANHELQATTLASTAAEALHQITLSEVAKYLGLERSGLLRRLQREPNLLTRLPVPLNVIEETQAMNVHIEPLSTGVVSSAQSHIRELGLLTNDALVIAFMRRRGLSHLATNDDDFDRIAGEVGITIWKPR